MKKYLYTILFFVAVCTGCKEGVGRNVAWTTKDPATLDVLHRLEKVSLQRSYPDSAHKLVDTLKLLPECQTRYPELYWYWKGKMARSALMHDSARVWISRAREMCDTSTHKYEFELIKLLESDYEDNYVVRYSGLTQSVAYFGSIGDTLTEANALNCLGRLHYELRDTAKAIDCISAARRKYEERRERLLSKYILLNTLPYYASCGDFARIKSILHSMCQDKEIMSDSAFLCNWRINAWSYLGDREALDSLYALTYNRGGHLDESFKAAILYYKGLQWISEGDSVSALKAFARSADLAKFSNNTMLKAEIFDSYSSLLVGKGEYRKAYNYKSYSNAIRDSVNKVRAQNTISAIEAKAELERRKVDEDYSRKKNTLVTLLSGTSIIVVLLGILVWYTRRNARLKLRAAGLRTDLERNRHLLAKAIQSMGEKSNYIATLSTRLDDFESHDSLPGLNTHQRINNISRKNDDDFDHLRRLVDEVSSTLVLNLKKHHPDISDGMLRLAVLVASGLNSKEIASTLNIQPESVKKQRYRLRLMLNLEQGQNLTDYLRSMC